MIYIVQHNLKYDYYLCIEDNYINSKRIFIMIFYLLTSYSKIYYNYKQSMSSAKFALGTTGIFVAYLINSITLQKIFGYSYPLRGQDIKQEDRFQYSDLLLLIGNIFCLLYAYISSKIKNQPPNPLPLKEICLLGVLYYINVVALNYSLYYIPYPIKVVGDKLGYLTAVIVGVYFSRVKKSSPLKLKKGKLLIAFLITTGTLMFSYFYQGTKKTQENFKSDKMWIGYVLLGTSVIFQAFFSDCQAYNKITYKPTASHLLISVNIISIILNLSFLIAKDNVIPSIQFCLNHEEIVLDILSYSSLTIIGQASIYYIILNFKQHIFPLISTVRKVVTILLSIYLFQHPMNIWLWIALILIFGGIVSELVDQMYYDNPNKQSESTKPAVKND